MSFRNLINFVRTYNLTKNHTNHVHSYCHWKPAKTVSYYRCQTRNSGAESALHFIRKLNKLKCTKSNIKSSWARPLYTTTHTEYFPNDKTDQILPNKRQVQRGWMHDHHAPTKSLPKGCPFGFLYMPKTVIHQMVNKSNSDHCKTRIGFLAEKWSD